MGLPGMHTGGKRVQPPHPMGKPLFNKKFQRTVSHRRLVAIALGREAFKHIIGPHGAMFLKQDLQNPPPHRRQPRTAEGNQPIGAFQHILGAMGMIMAGKGRSRLLAGRTI